MKWSSTINELEKRGTSAEVLGLVRDYLSQRYVRVEEKYEFVTKKLYKGCPLGSILGPDLWNIVMDGLLKALEEAGAIAISYADDVVIIVHGNSRREIERNAKVYMDILVTWSMAEGLVLSKEKTEMVMLKDSGKGIQTGKRKGTKGYNKKIKAVSVKGSLIRVGKGGFRPPTIKMGTSSVKYSSVVEYLGVKLGTRSTITTHVKGAATKGKSLFFKLGMIARANWGLKFSCLKTLYTGVFVPMVLYGVGSWGDLINRAHRRTLLSAQRQALIRICRAYRTTSTDALQVICGLIPIDILAIEYFFRYKVRTGENFGYEDFNFNSHINKKLAYKKLREISMDLWQKRLETSEKGRNNFLFFPSIKDRLKLKHYNPDFRSTQFVSGHGDFNAKLNSFKLTESDLCICGESEDGNHILYECREYEEIRSQLKQECIKKYFRWPIEASEFVKDPEIWKHFTVMSKLLLEHKKMLN